MSARILYVKRLKVTKNTTSFFCMLEAIYQWPDDNFLGAPHFVGAHVLVKINIVDKILK